MSGGTDCFHEDLSVLLTFDCDFGVISCYLTDLMVFVVNVQKVQLRNAI